MKNVYLIWAIVGAVVPKLFFLGVFHEQMVGLTGFVPALFVNGPAGGCAADLFITSFVFWTYMFSAESGRRRPGGVGVGGGAATGGALPAYLYRRTVLAQVGKGEVA